VEEGALGRVREAGAICLAAAVAGFAGLFWFRRHAASATRWLDAGFEKWPAPLARAGRLGTTLLSQLADTLGVFANARELAATVGWTAALWAAITLANMLVLRAFGLALGVSETVFVLGWSLVGSLLPTPGAGAGTYHAATAHGLVAYLGTGKSEADAATIVLHLVVFGSSLFFGLYYFLRGGVSLARLRGAVESGERAGAEQAGGGREQLDKVSGSEFRVSS
ncbi:MAG: flippase-like domain-containing protein, partial [Acidobacteriota bacterium]|nr:flippase-like domain-containing protein [Acidobacteriota bacterium]